MSKINALVYKSVGFDFNINAVLLLSLNKKQLEDLSKRFLKINNNEDELIVLEIEKPLINHLGQVAIKSLNETDENYLYHQDDINHLDIKDKNLYNWNEVLVSLSSKDFDYIHSYVIGHDDEWRQEEKLNNKINKAKRNGDYYLNPEKYKM